MIEQHGRYLTVGRERPLRGGYFRTASAWLWPAACCLTHTHAGQTHPFGAGPMLIPKRPVNKGSRRRRRLPARCTKRAISMNRLTGATPSPLLKSLGFWCHHNLKKFSGFFPDPAADGHCWHIGAGTWSGTSKNCSTRSTAESAGFPRVTWASGRRQWSSMLKDRGVAMGDTEHLSGIVILREFSVRHGESILVV